MRVFVAMLVIATSAFSSLMTSAAAQEAVKFAASQPYEPEHVLLNSEIYRPKGNGPFPAVVLMHGCGGWQPPVQSTLHTYAVALVNLGYVVLNMDSWGPRHYSGDVQCKSNERLQQALVYRTSDAFDAARHLRNQPFVDPRNIFLMGKINGGCVGTKAARAGALDKSRDSAFRGVVAFYPWFGVFVGNVQLASPMLV